MGDHDVTTPGSAWAHFRPYRGRILGVAALSTLFSLFEAIGLASLLPIIEGVVEGDETSAVTGLIESVFSALGLPFTRPWLLGFVIVLFAAKAVLEFFSLYLSSTLAKTYSLQTMTRMFRRCTEASWEFFAHQSVGHLLNIMVEIRRVGSFLRAAMGQLTHVLFTIVIVGASFVVSARLTLFAILFLASSMAVVALVAPRVEGHGREILDSSQRVSEVMAQYLSGYKTMKAFNALGPALGRVEEQAVRRERAQVRVVRLDAALVVVPEALLVVALVALVAVAATGDQGVAELGVVMAMLFRVAQRAKAMRQLATLKEFLPIIRLIDETEAAFAESATGTTGTGPAIEGFDRELRFEDVSFTYAGARATPAVRAMDFSIQPGEVVGIVGSSGAGKSTLTGLLLGLLRPTSGRVLVDDRDLADVPLESWLGQIGYVPQESFLLNGTVEENISMFRDLDQAEVAAAARKANIADLIESMPDGYRTRVGENGVELSGGERQRICLARALAGSPRVLVLDEATSALDGESERAVQDAISGVRGGITVIMIAHRLSTVADADQLLVLDKGALVESGSPQDLLARPDGSYRRMHALQKGASGEA